LKAARTSTVPAKASQKEPLKADPIAVEPGKMMAFMKAPWKWTVSVKKPTKLASRQMASQKVRTRAEPTEIESRAMASQKVWTMAETMEPESLPKASAKAQRMGSLKTALTAMVPAKALPKEPLNIFGKAQTRGFLKAARTSTVPAKASQKELLKADPIAVEPEKMMAFVKAPWKWTVSVKEPTKAGPTELAS
jgi:hypothetical protein